MIRVGIQSFPKLVQLQVSKYPFHQAAVKALNLQPKPTLVDFARTTTFFNKLSASEIWKANNTVSNAGKRRGRGKTKKKNPFFLRGSIGIGEKNMQWPGLNTPILQGQDVINVGKQRPDVKDEEKAESETKNIIKRKRPPVHPLERGFSGRSLLGKNLGPPSDIGNMEDFESYVLDMKYLLLPRSKLGKVRSLGIFLVTGNKRGLLGVGYAKGTDSKVAVKRAMATASKRLFQIKLEEQFTVNHDFFYQLGFVKVFAYRRPQGYGLVCHRAIAVICKLVGITDIYVKVEGSGNKTHVVKAFILGLLDQKSWSNIAESNKLHLVEQMEERFMYPRVLGSPEGEVATTRDVDTPFSQYIMGGRLPLKRVSLPPAEITRGFALHIKKSHYKRNHKQVKLRMMAYEGYIKSYLTDIYPECLASFITKPDMQRDEYGNYIYEYNDSKPEEESV